MCLSNVSIFHFLFSRKMADKKLCLKMDNGKLKIEERKMASHMVGHFSLRREWDYSPHGA